MAKFHVGQRVRLVASVYGPQHIGSEGRITEIQFRREGTISYKSELYLHDTHYFAVFDGENEVYAVAEWQLEPLTRPDASTETDRNAIVEWSDCEWMPAHLRERA